MHDGALLLADILESIFEELDGPSTLFAMRVCRNWARVLRDLHRADIMLFERPTAPERFYARWPLYAAGNLRLLQELGDPPCEASLWRVAVEGNVLFFMEFFAQWPRNLARLQQQGWMVAEPGTIVDPMRAYFLEQNVPLYNKWVYWPVYRPMASARLLRRV